MEHQPQAICDPTKSPEATIGGGANLPSDDVGAFTYICDPSQDPGRNGDAPKGSGMNLSTDGPGDFQAIRPEFCDYSSTGNVTTPDPTWVVLDDGSIISPSDSCVLNGGDELPPVEKY